MERNDLYMMNIGIAGVGRWDPKEDSIECIADRFNSNADEAELLNTP
jgi:hypothetical protein